MYFSTNPEKIEVTDPLCKTIEPHTKKEYKREIAFDGGSDNSSDNDLPHIENILKKGNVPDVCTEFESSSSLSVDSREGTEIASWMDAETEEPIKYQRKRRYINYSVFKDLQAISVKEVPLGMDGTIIYEVPQNNILNLDNCKGARPWCNAQSSKSKEFDRGPRILFNCCGSYFCMNKYCKNICDFGVTQKVFRSKDNAIFCLICNFPATYIQCDARLVIEKDNFRKINTCKHNGTHNCVVETEGRMDKYSIELVNNKYPKLAHESIVWQELQKEKLQDSSRITTRTHRYKLHR